MLSGTAMLYVGKVASGKLESPGWASRSVLNRFLEERRHYGTETRDKLPCIVTEAQVRCATVNLFYLPVLAFTITQTRAALARASTPCIPIMAIHLTFSPPRPIIGQQVSDPYCNAVPFIVDKGPDKIQMPFYQGVKIAVRADLSGLAVTPTWGIALGGTAQHTRLRQISAIVKIKLWYVCRKSGNVPQHIPHSQVRQEMLAHPRKHQ